MPNYIMTRPRFTAEDFDDEKQRRKIIAWLVQLDEQLITTNTVPHADAEDFRIHTLCVAPLLAEAIKRIHEGESVSSLFE